MFGKGLSELQETGTEALEWERLRTSKKAGVEQSVDKEQESPGGRPQPGEEELTCVPREGTYDSLPNILMGSFWQLCGGGEEAVKVGFAVRRLCAVAHIRLGPGWWQWRFREIVGFHV